MEQKLIICIVNSGFADAVMDAARDAGARGGTIVNARGAARAEAEKKYQVSIHQDKDLVLIVVDETIREEILHLLYKKVGFNTPAQGFLFSLPIDESAGFNNPSNIETSLDDSEEE